MSAFRRPPADQINPLGLVSWAREQAKRSDERNRARLQRGQLKPYLADKDALYWQALIALAEIDAGLRVSKPTYSKAAA